MRYITTLLLCLTLLFVWSSGQQTGSAPPNPCAARGQRQLDFWVGEWDLTWPGNKAGEVQHGTNSIRRVLDGCVVEENFSGEGDMHLRGKSISIFDTRAGKWKQTWVDNEGGYLDVDFRHQCWKVEADLGGQRRWLPRLRGGIQRWPDDSGARGHASRRHQGNAQNGIQEHQLRRIRLELGRIQRRRKDVAGGVADPLQAPEVAWV